MFNLEKFRRGNEDSDNSIDLVDATVAYMGLGDAGELLPNAMAFLLAVEDIHPIHSRQAAAIAIAMATKL
jgi:hypothetical protein